MKKITSLFLSFVLAIALMTGCGNVDSNSTSQTQSQSTTATEGSSTQSTDTESENKAAANQLLSDLTGSYQELWPVILSDEYKQIWIDDCTELVGADNAQGAYEKLASMVSGKVYGDDAVDAYKDDGGAYFCGFTQELSKLEFDGETSTIKGYDASNKELFSHTYHYIGMEENRGLYEFESDDKDSGEFTYFFLAPDTSDTTYHIEFRYGSDADALSQYDAGDYAYWLASGISTDYDQTMVEKCIQIFCTENLSE